MPDLQGAPRTEAIAWQHSMLRMALGFTVCCACTCVHVLLLACPAKESPLPAVGSQEGRGCPVAGPVGLPRCSGWRAGGSVGAGGQLIVEQKPAWTSLSMFVRACVGSSWSPLPEFWGLQCMSAEADHESCLPAGLHCTSVVVHQRSCLCLAGPSFFLCGSLLLVLSKRLDFIIGMCPVPCH